ncbi:AT hook motif family protein [Aspergillus tubingensis]|uniref:AT hook motif family protein n=1 Tax=Aspergillus tubingensis TaxID=5068 RepID=UPI001577EF0B|nr:AT hook motif family protein [Aspergillus tubingensis]GFN20842.1 AT hook motif family protein [Aspergillus tubingensis]
MFLPKLSREGQKILRDRTDFVRSQLQHYGVPFEEDHLTGNRTQLMKKVLQEGKCDKVPVHILTLEEQLHQEWIAASDIEVLSSNPEWVIKKFFIRAGGPDLYQTRTSTVVEVSFPRYSEYRPGRLREAADQVAGLHHDTGVGPETQTIFLGWDKSAVREAAKEHANKERTEIQAREQRRENERAKMHADYLATLGRMKGAAARNKWPVGSYIVDCHEIENGWPSLARDMVLEIVNTEQKGKFHATFNFGVVIGVMVIYEEHMTETDEEQIGDDHEKIGKRTKRKTIAQKHSRPLKKAKAEKTSEPYTYRLKLRCRETGEGQIFFKPEYGTIKFRDEKFAAFTAEAVFPCVGSGITFTARKVSDDPCPSGEKWEDYSEEAYEYARVSRWQ